MSPVLDRRATARSTAVVKKPILTGSPPLEVGFFKKKVIREAKKPFAVQLVRLAGKENPGIVEGGTVPGSKNNDVVKSFAWLSKDTSGLVETLHGDVALVSFVLPDYMPSAKVLFLGDEVAIVRFNNGVFNTASGQNERVFVKRCSGVSVGECVDRFNSTPILCVQRVGSNLALAVTQNPRSKSVYLFVRNPVSQQLF